MKMRLESLVHAARQRYGAWAAIFILFAALCTLSVFSARDAREAAAEPEVSGFSAPGGSALQQPPLREISADPCDDFAASKTEYKKTEIRENDLSADGYDATFFSNRIKGNIDYDILSEYKVDKAKLDELIRLMTDVCCGTAPMVRIGGSEYRRQDVAERFLSLDDAHIEYVMDKLESGTANVKNMRAYALTVLYNAPATMELDLERQLRHDFACNA